MAACTGTTPGTSTTADVTFAGAASDQCVISTGNPQSGPAGDASGFSGAFGAGAWSLLAKITTPTGSVNVSGVHFAWTFSPPSGTTGTWSLTADKSVVLDLVFDMHAGDRNDAFLFDDQPTVANQVNSGVWSIKWLNSGGQVPNFSNLTLFDRNITISTVPEPETSALMWAGLGAMGFVARRRKTK